MYPRKQTVIGSTGPVLAYSTAVYEMSKSIGVPYYAFNGWISIWILFYAFLAAFFDVTRVVRLATRFLDEIFASLIVTIFVFDAIGDPFSGAGMLRYFDPNHGSHEDLAAENPDYNYLETALLSVLLGLGTCWLIFFFRGFKNSSFFCNDTVRSSVHDFSVSVSVLLFSLIKGYLFPSIETETLKVPDQFEPTFSCCDDACTMFFPDDCLELDSPAGVRPWFVDLGDLNGKTWAIFAAAGPAVMAFLLVFLDNGITWHLINHPSHKLKHGEAYNYDLMLSGIFNCVNGLLGLPWLVASTVPCIIHLHGLAEKDESGKITSVHETRLTNLLAHVMMAACIAALNVLKLIPLPVLYGVFLFMGLSSLPPMQFWNRILMFFKQPNKYPTNYPFSKYLPKERMHKYTCFQLLFFCGVFVVMNIPAISIVFPFMTLICIPVRLYLLPRFFAGWELCLLDGGDDEIAEWIRLREENDELSMRAIQFGDDITVGGVGTKHH